MTTIQPLTSRILLKPVLVESSGLIIPESCKPDESTPITAEVVQLGTRNLDRAARPIDWTVSPGDRVLIVAYMGAEIEIQGERHLIAKESDILCIL